jgi:spermidine synthase/Tfp pilus assembly protein PilF
VSGGACLLAVGGVAGGVFASPILFRSVVGNISRTELRGPLTMNEIAGMSQVTFAEEGVNATVVVVREQGYVSLHTNGKIEASQADQQTQLMGAFMPLGLHPKPRRVLLVGFGSGATLFAATRFAAVEQLDCVEIEPAVLAAAPFMEELNRGVERHPKVRIIYDDARNYLRATDQRYDLIISEPSYVWSAGVAALFTQDFYDQALGHLAPGGLFVQWVQAYHMSFPNFATVVRTLGSRFEQISLWRGLEVDFLLLASPKPRRLSLQPLITEFERNGELRMLLDKHLSIEEPAGLLAYYLLDDKTLRQISAAGDINSEDRTVLEYRAPFDIARRTEHLNHAVVAAARREILPDFLDLNDPAAAALAAARTQVRVGMLRHRLGAPMVAAALELSPPSERTFLLRANVARAQGRQLEALEHLEQAQKLAPRSAEVAYNLAEFYFGQGKEEEARTWLERTLELMPDHLPALRALGDLESRAGRLSRAIELTRRVIEHRPPLEREELFGEWARLGELYLRAGQQDAAIDAFEESQRLEPLGFLVHRRTAELLARAGRVDEAIREYEFLVQYYPHVEPAIYLELSRLYQERGEPARARKTLKKAKRIFPVDPVVEQATWQLSR